MGSEATSVESEQAVDGREVVVNWENRQREKKSQYVWYAQQASTLKASFARECLENP